jgi:predicted nucleic acid-binding protein
VILIDTSVWADHLRRPEPGVTDLGRAGDIIMHPFIIGELVAGNLPNWDQTLSALRLLPRAQVLDEGGYYAFVRQHGLMGSGLSFVDIHLLASVMQTTGAKIWTRDKRLAAQANKNSLLFTPS